MAINYVRQSFAKKSRENSTAARDSADYVLRLGKYKNSTEEKEDGQQHLFKLVPENEKIITVSEEVPKDWKKENAKDGEQFRAFSVDADNLERANSQTLNKLVLALPRELKDEKEQAQYLKDFMKETGLDKQPHLAVMHLDPQNHNPHAHILFSARGLDFECPNKNDGSLDKKAFFSRQNPKNTNFSGSYEKAIKWSNDAKKTNENLIRQIPGLQDWKPKAGKSQIHEGRERNTDTFRIIKNHNQDIKNTENRLPQIFDFNQKCKPTDRAGEPKFNFEGFKPAKSATPSATPNSQPNQAGLGVNAAAMLKPVHEEKKKNEATPVDVSKKMKIESDLFQKRDELNKAPPQSKPQILADIQKLESELSKLQQPQKQKQEAGKKMDAYTPPKEEPRPKNEVQHAPKGHDYGRDLDKAVSLKEVQDNLNKAQQNRLQQQEAKAVGQYDRRADSMARDSEKMFQSMANHYDHRETAAAKQRYDAMPETMKAEVLDRFNDAQLFSADKSKASAAGNFMTAINHTYADKIEAHLPTISPQGFITSAEKMKMLNKKKRPAYR